MGYIVFERGKGRDVVLRKREYFVWSNKMLYSIVSNASTKNML